MIKFAPAGESDFEYDDDEFEFGQDIDLSVLSSLHDDVPEDSLPSVNLNLNKNVPSNCLLNGGDGKVNILLLSDLQNAVINGNVKAVGGLLEKCNDLRNSILDSGWTALIYAANFGHLNVVNMLLREGADVNLCGSDGCTPLMAACKCKKKPSGIEIVKIFLEKGADVTALDKTNKTALVHAVKNGDNTLVRILSNVTSDEINLKDNKGWTALDWAICKNSEINVKCLLEFGANIYDFKMDLSTTSSGIKECLTSISTIKTPDKVNFNETIGNDDSKVVVDQVPGLEEGDNGSLKQNQHLSAVSFVDNNDGDIVTIRTEPSNEGYQTYGQLELLLCGLELSHLIPKFHEHDVRFDQLLYASNDDLIAIGIHQVGARNRILSAIKDWHSVEWKENSLPNFSSTALTFGNLQALLRTSSEHLLYISSSLRYAKAQLQMYPQVMVPPASIQLDDNPDSHIVSQVEDLLASTHILCQSLKSLHLQAMVIKKENSQQYQQVDYIGKNNQQVDYTPKNVQKYSRRRRTIIFISLPLITCLVIHIARHNCTK